MDRTCLAPLAPLAAFLAQPLALADPIVFGTLQIGGVTALRLPNSGNAPEITFAVSFDGYNLSGTICDSNACGPGFGTAIPQVDLLNFSATCVTPSPTTCGAIGFRWGETLDTGIPFDPAVTPDVGFSSHIGGTFFPTTTPPAADIIRTTDVH